MKLRPCQRMEMKPDVVKKMQLEIGEHFFYDVDGHRYRCEVVEQRIERGVCRTFAIVREEVTLN